MSLLRWPLGIALSLLFAGTVSGNPRPNRSLTSDDVQGPIDALVFYSGEQLVSFDREGQIATWDLKSGTIIGSLYAGKTDDRWFIFDEKRAALSLDGTLLFAGGGIWDLCSEKLIFKVRGDGGLAISSSLLARGTSFLGGISLHDFVSGEDRTQVVPNNPVLRPLVFSADGNLLAAESLTGELGALNTHILLFDLATKQVCLRVPSPVFQARARISQNNRMLCLGGYGTVMVCDTETGKMLWKAGRSEDPRNLSAWANKIGPVLAMSPDDRLLAVVAGSFVDVYEAATGQLRCQLGGGKGLGFADVRAPAFSALAFSRDGGSLAAGSSDSKILLWNLRGRDATLPSLSAQHAEAAWSDLVGGNGPQVHQAIERLVSSPDQAIALFRRRLPPPKRIVLEPERIRKLIADLGHSKFSVRNNAQTELENLGPPVAPALREAQKKATALETSMRIGRLLKRLDEAKATPETLRKRRAIEILELIGSPETINLLQQQTPSYAQDEVAADARAALKRIKQGLVPRKPKALKKEPMPLRDGEPAPSPDVRPLPPGQRITVVLPANLRLM